MQEDNISTVGGYISTMGVSVRWRDTFSTVEGDNSSTCGGYLQYCRDTFSTVEAVQYSGG